MDSERSEEYFMRVATLTTCNENVRGAEEGDSRIAPTTGLSGFIFVAIGHVGFDRRHLE